MKEKVRVAIQVSLNTPIRYSIAMVTGGAHDAEARRFVAYLGSPAAQVVFTRHGFVTP